MKHHVDTILVLLFFYALTGVLCIGFAVKGWWFFALMFAIAAGFNMTALQHFKV